MTVFVLIIVVLALAMTAWLFYLGKASKSGSAPGLVNSQLAECPDKPNCVCSEYPQDKSHYIKAISYSAHSTENLSDLLQKTLEEMGGDIQRTDNVYLAATFSSSLFGFIDDLELRIDSSQQVVHVRSASRVGDSDLGVNRKRVEQLKSHLQARLR